MVFSFTNLSLLPLELMSCGCVVVSNRDDNTEWLLNDSNSILPTSSSPRVVADAIIGIMNDDVARLSLVKGAKAFAMSTDWEVEGDKMINVFQKIAIQ